jgi:hypothetical protein
MHQKIMLWLKKDQGDTGTDNYNSASIGTIAARLDQDIKEKPLKDLSRSLLMVKPKVFEILCDRQDTHMQVFLRIACLPEELQKKLFTEYIFSDNDAATELLRGCSIPHKNVKPLPYADALIRLADREQKHNTISFLTLADIYCLEDKQFTLCRYIGERKNNTETRIDLAQEETVRTLPAYIKHKMIAGKLLCQRSYRERICRALRTIGLSFMNCLQNYKSTSPKKSETIYWLLCNVIGWSIYSIGCGMYDFVISGYEFPHEKTMHDV